MRQVLSMIRSYVKIVFPYTSFYFLVRTPEAEGKFMIQARKVIQKAAVHGSASSG